MENRYKQLEQDVSALSSVISQLGARLSDAAKDATASGMLPSEKLIEQIQAARVNFENVRSAVHGQATAMLVSPLPKVGELMSIASLNGLLKAAAAAEEGKASSQAERDKAVAILARVLGIAHRETPDFKPLQECHAKINELKTAISGVAWPNRHPELDAVLGSKHPSCSLLDFVENLDTLEDEKWISLEATITGAYGKPLFVAASRGKLVASGEKKTPPVEKPASVEKPVGPTAAPVSVEKKVATPPAPVVNVVEKKEVAPEPPKPAAPPAPAPVMAVEKKEAPAVVPSVQPVSPAPATPAPSVASVPSAPPAAAAQHAPTVVETPVPARPPAPAAVPIVAQTPTPAPAHTEPAASAGPSLSALANATDPAKVAGSGPSKDPRLATPPAAPQPVPSPKVESKPQDPEPTSEELQKAMAGDGAQRPQRWGFWRGNR